MMKRWMSGMAAACVLLGATEALPCGGKYLVKCPSVRPNQIQTAAHPSSILIYRNPASSATEQLLTSKLVFNLELARHSVTTVRSREDFETASRSGEFQIVLADFMDAEWIRDGLDELAFIFVIESEGQPFGKEKAESYPFLLPSSSDTHEVMAMIDRVIASLGTGV